MTTPDNMRPSQILAIRQRARAFGRAVAPVGGELGTIGNDMSTSINLDRGTQGDEGHFVTIEGHVVFIKDDTGHGANGRGGKFTRHAIEKKILDHHKERGGDEAELHRTAKGNDTGDSGQYKTSSARPFHFEGDSQADLPAEVKDWIDGDLHKRSLFTVSRGKGAAGADVMAEMGDDYWKMAEEALGGKLNAAKETARKSDDPEIRFFAAMHDNLPKTKTATASKTDFTGKGGRARMSVETFKATQGIMPADKLREGHEFTINGTSMKVINSNGELHLEGSGYPSTPLGALNEVPIDKLPGGGSTLKMGRRSVSKEVVPFSRTIELARKELTGGRWVTIHPHGDEGSYVRLYIKSGGKIAAGPKSMVGKDIGHLHDTHEVRESSHPHSPLKVKDGGTFTAQKVDPNRQLGMFAKDDKGNHQEVGERAGQGSLFHDTAKAKPTVDKAQAKRDEDAKATGEMFPAKRAEKQPHEMTKAEFSDHRDSIRRNKIDAWNKSGGKGLPPAIGGNSIADKNALAEVAGLKPGSQEFISAVIGGDLHRLHVRAAIASGKTVPANVLADYPDLAPKEVSNAGAPKMEASNPGGKLVPHAAKKAYDTYRGNAEAAWRAGDEAATFAIRQHKDAIESGAKIAPPLATHREKWVAPDGGEKKNNSAKLSGVYARIAIDAIKAKATRTGMTGPNSSEKIEYAKSIRDFIDGRGSELSHDEAKQVDSYMRQSRIGYMDGKTPVFSGVTITASPLPTTPDAAKAQAVERAKGNSGDASPRTEAAKVTGDDIATSGDLDNSALRDLKAKSMERAKGNALFDSIVAKAKAENWNNRKIKDALYEVGIVHRMDDARRALGREKGPSSDDTAKAKADAKAKVEADGRAQLERSVVERSEAGKAEAAKADARKAAIDADMRSHIADKTQPHWDTYHETIRAVARYGSKREANRDRDIGLAVEYRNADADLGRLYDRHRSHLGPLAEDLMEKGFKYGFSEKQGRLLAVLFAKAKTKMVAAS